MGKGSYVGLSSKKKRIHIGLYLIFFICFFISILNFYLILFCLCLVFYLNYAISFCLFYDICE